MILTIACSTKIKVDNMLLYNTIYENCIELSVYACAHYDSVYMRQLGYHGVIGIILYDDSNKPMLIVGWKEFVMNSLEQTKCIDTFNLTVFYDMVENSELPMGVRRITNINCGAYTYTLWIIPSLRYLAWIRKNSCQVRIRNNCRYVLQ